MQNGRRKLVGNYLLAVTALAAAVILQMLLGLWLGTTPPFVAIYPAILLVVVVCGMGPALFAILLAAAVAAYQFMEPTGSLRITASRDAASLVLFGISAVLLAVIARRLGIARTNQLRLESEEKYRAVVEHANDGIVIVQDGIIKYANPRIVQFQGSSVEEFVGSPITDHVDPRDVDKVTGMYRRRLAGEKVSSSYEVLLKRGDGSFAYADLNAAVVTYEGRPAVLAIIRDITDRKRDEEALRKSEERFRIAQELSPDGFTILHPLRDHSGEIADFVWIYENEAIARLNGTELKEVIGKKVSDVFPTTSTQFHQLFKRVANTGNPEVMEGPYQGDTIPKPAWLRVVVVPMDEDIAILTQDITERKCMDEELRQSRAELEQRVKERTAELSRANEKLIEEVQLRSKAEKDYVTLLQNSPNMIARLDRGLRFVYANSAVEKITGVPNSQRVGRTIKEIEGHEETDQKLERHIRDAFDTGREEIVQEAVQVGTEQLYVSTAFVPEFAEDGSVESVLVVTHDITKERELEEQLAQAHKMEALGTLAGGIAHDFNNMLAVILGNAEIALDDIDGKGPHKHIQAIVKASTRSRDLVKQILTFTRRMVNQGQVVNVVPLLEETCALLRASLPSTIRIDTDIRTEPDAAIFADPSEFQQIVLNLANNAAYAMREKGGSLSIQLSSVTLAADSKRKTLHPGPYMKLMMRDTGTGMSPEVQARIFEPFFTTKPLGQGAGMGLSVVHGIVEASKGAVEVESTVGKGSVFNVLLPRYSRVTGKEEQEQTFVPAAGKHILFVDDEPDIVEMARKLLESVGYRVTSFTDPSLALDVFTRNPSAFDLIITDQTMPNLTGVGFSEKVLAIRRDMPIILCTGYSEMVSPEKARELGIREYVMKPITKKEIGQAISRALEQKQGAKQVF